MFHLGNLDSKKNIVKGLQLHSPREKEQRLGELKSWWNFHTKQGENYIRTVWHWWILWIHQDLLLTDPMGFISRGVSGINQLSFVLSSSMQWFKVSDLSIPPAGRQQDSPWECRVPTRTAEMVQAVSKSVWRPSLGEAFNPPQIATKPAGHLQNFAWTHTSFFLLSPTQGF